MRSTAGAAKNKIGMRRVDKAQGLQAARMRQEPARQYARLQCVQITCKVGVAHLRTFFLAESDEAKAPGLVCVFVRHNFAVFDAAKLRKIVLHIRHSRCPQ